MRKASWATACIVAGAGVGLGFYATFWKVVYRSLPLVEEMKAACRVGGTHAVPADPKVVTAADCRAYFADLETFHHTAMIGCLLTALIAAFIFLVLRFRVRPLAA